MTFKTVLVSATTIFLIGLATHTSGDNCNNNCGTNNDCGSGSNISRVTTLTNLIQLLYHSDDNGKNPCSNNQEYITNRAIGSCYKFHPLGSTWVEAKAICEMEGAEMAMVNSQEEADHLMRLFNANHNEIENVESASVVRLGLRLISKTWRYPDGTDLEASGYSRWGPGEPNNVRVNNCGGILINGLLDDIRCNNNVAFICEKKLIKNNISLR